MRSGCFVVPDPFGEDPAQVPLAKRDQIVKALAPDRADRALAQTVRLRRSDWRLQNLQSQAPD